VNGLCWAGAAPPFRPRVVVAAPHPDDEVLGCAGIMRWLQDDGYVVEVVAVTDGDASHARSERITRPELVDRRQAERREAFVRLGIEPAAVRRLGLPDAGVAGHEQNLAIALGECLDGATTLIVPWRHDGHPDHEAVARAGLDAARARSAGCLEVPIWARVRGKAFRPDYALELHEFRCAKRAAAQAFDSQIRPLGPDAADGPVVHPHELEALTSGFEWLGEAS
jgi:LmbE family N-acetylglucosaminyl deacetylase